MAYYNVIITVIHSGGIFISFHFQHAITTLLYQYYSRCGKREAHINWSMVTCKMAAPVTGTALRTTGPVPVDSRQ